MISINAKGTKGASLKNAPSTPFDFEQVNMNRTARALSATPAVLLVTQRYNVTSSAKSTTTSRTRIRP